MADFSKVKLQHIKMRLITQVGEEIFDEEIDTDEKFMADMIIAIRNSKSPADALSYLADLGSNHIGDPNVQISTASRIGYR